MKYGINLTWNELQKDPQTRELVRQYLPALEALAKQVPGAANISIRTAKQYAPQMFPAEKVAALDHALHEYGTTRPLTAEENAKLARYRTIQATHKTVAHPEQAVLYDAFHPRQVWRDTSGNPPGPWRRCAVGERILVLVR